MSGKRRPSPQSAPRRQYLVGKNGGHARVESPSSGATTTNDNSTAIQEMEEAAAGATAVAEGTVRPSEPGDPVDPKRLGKIDGQLNRGFIEGFEVTDDEAKAALDLVEGAPRKEIEGLVEAMRDSGKLSTMLKELPAESREKMSGYLASLVAGDRVDAMLSRDVFDVLVTDGERDEAVDVLKSMELSDAQNTITELSPLQRAELSKSLDAQYAAETDPKKKLQLWSLMHTNRVEGAMTDKREAEPDASDLSPEAKLIRHRNAQRDRTADDTRREILGEVDALTKRMQAGETITAADIEALDKRKQKELALEQRYGVNLTNDEGEDTETGGHAKRERRVWSEQELGQLENAFSRMPIDHLKNNPALTNIHRQDSSWSKDGTSWKANRDVGADAGGGQIRFFDTGAGFNPATGASATALPWRIDDPKSELAGHQGTNKSTGLIEEVLSHEAGHTVHQGDNKLWQDFKKLSGWEKLSKDEVKAKMKAAGLDDQLITDQLTDLDAARNDSYDNRIEGFAGEDMYEVDPYSDGYLSVKETAVPVEGEWGYARSNPEDHFAEIYTKAIHEPEELHNDLIAQPQEELGFAKDDLATAQLELERLRKGGSAEEIAIAEETVGFLKDDLKRYQATANTRRAQWDLFRKDVFKTDDSDIQSLTAPAGKEAIYEEYKAKAAKAMTPDQLKELKKQYADKL